MSGINNTITQTNNDYNSYNDLNTNNKLTLPRVKISENRSQSILNTIG